MIHPLTFHSCQHPWTHGIGNAVQFSCTATTCCYRLLRPAWTLSVVSKAAGVKYLTIVWKSMCDESDKATRGVSVSHVTGNMPECARATSRGRLTEDRKQILDNYRPSEWEGGMCFIWDQGRCQSKPRSEPHEIWPCKGQAAAKRS